ncbi:MAG: hypothetical protein BGP04_02460 [Rhizobiales bacterium 62-17]|nr:helix-turn-helix domain-containing protein [Hyphomicrobiales bacterium]OJY04294.1 MAG: hypothetical protein BGP04_02460 [Rhizobiales bacterium 62-17]
MAADGLILSTDMVAPDLRTDMCREISRPFFEPTLLADAPGSLELSLQTHLFGRTVVMASRHGQQQYRRDRRHVLGGMDQYFIRLLLAGDHNGACEDRTILVAAGDICVFDLSRPFQGEGGNGSVLSLMLPRNPVDKVTGGRDLHGLLLKKDEPTTRFLTDFMISFATLAKANDGQDTQAIEDAAINLIGACLARQTPPQQDPALAHVLRHRLLHFIDTHLADPALGPALLMQRFQVSRAHLYRMFETEGGVATVIREKRLDAAFHALASSDGKSRSVTEIAHRFGFSSSTQFHRAFRTRFSLTPNQARSERSTTPHQRLKPLGGLFDEYVRQLNFGVSRTPPTGES